MKHEVDRPPFVLYAGTRHAHLGQCQCDCACAVDPVPALPARHGSHVPLQQAGMVSWPLASGWQAAYNPGGPIGVVALSPAAQRVLVAFQRPALLNEVSRHVPALAPAVARQAAESLLSTGLLRPVGATAVIPRPASTLAAWLHVTDACNLACPYCYVSKRPTAMTAAAGLDTVDRLIRMARQHGYRTLRLKYAGGEPTLNMSVVEVIHRYTARLAMRAGVVLEEVVLSNGVGVSDAMLEAMASAAMGLMVSLDGGRDAHNRLRSIRGKSTYEAVVGTVERAMTHGLRPDISITLTTVNLDGVVEAAGFALEHDLPFSLNFYRECAREPAARFLPAMSVEPAQLAGAVRAVLRLVEDHPAYAIPVSGIVDRVRLDVPHHYACSAGRDYLAVDARGGTAPCPMLLDEPWSYLKAQDPLAEMQERGRGTFRPVEELPGCGGCIWQSACAGGCPLLRDTWLHDAYCLVYRTVLPELARLEARRLIARNGVAG